MIFADFFLFLASIVFVGMALGMAYDLVKERLLK